MLFEFSPKPPPRTGSQMLLLPGAGQIQLTFKRNLRARRYILRLDPKRHACVTIPAGGSVAAAWEFAESNRAWLERQLHRQASVPKRPQEWFVGTELLFRGEKVTITAEGNAETGLVRFGPEVLRVTDSSADLRAAIEWH